MSNPENYLKNIPDGHFRILQHLPSGGIEVCDDFPNLSLTERHIGYFNNGVNSECDVLEGHHSAYDHTGKKVL